MRYDPQQKKAFLGAHSLQKIVKASQKWLKSQDVYTLHKFVRGRFPVVVVVIGYPTPSEGWGHGEGPRSLRSRAIPQGLDQRS